LNWDQMEQPPVAGEAEQRRQIIEQFKQDVAQMHLHLLELYRKDMEKHLHEKIDEFCKHILPKMSRSQTDEEGSCMQLEDAAWNPCNEYRPQIAASRTLAIKAEHSNRMRNMYTKLCVKNSRYFELQNAGWLRRQVHGPLFQIFSSSLILGNALLLGLGMSSSTQAEVNRLSSNQRSGSTHNRSAYEAWELSFNIAFWIELLVRIVADRGLFVWGREYRWNIFDALIVGISVVEYLLPIRANVFTLRLIRVFRIGRLSKTFNSVAFVRNLGSMLASCMDAIRACLPALAVILLTTYLFGTLILQGVRESLKQQETPQYPLEKLTPLFGDLSKVMLTLFMSVSNGLSWQLCYDELGRVGLTYQLVFLAYIIVMELCVLNMILGIFVDTVQQDRRPDHEAMLVKQEKERKKNAKDLMTFFLEADTDGSRTLSFDELIQKMESQEFKLILMECNIEVEDSATLFKLLDADADGHVSIDEFVVGIDRLKTLAHSYELWELKEQVEKVTRGVDDISRAIQACAWARPLRSIQESQSDSCTSAVDPMRETL